MTGSGASGRGAGSSAALRAAPWLLLIIAPVVAGAACLSLLPLWRENVPLAAASTLLATCLFMTGMVLLAEPGQALAGLAMMLSACLYLVSWANEWRVSPTPLLSSGIGDLWILSAGWALYRYPYARLSPLDRRIFGLSFAWVLATRWIAILISRPQWYQFPADTWWPTLVADQGLARQVTRWFAFGDLVLLAAFVALWGRAVLTARPALRRVKSPPAMGAILAAFALSAVSIGRMLSLDDQVDNVLYAISAVGFLAVPAAFLISVVRRLLERKGAADVLLRLRGRPTPELVIASLREALHDPGLQVAYWSSIEGAYWAEGRIIDERWSRGDVIVEPVRSSTGEPLALIRVDAASTRDSTLVEATIAAFSLTLENALLLARSEGQLAQLRGASARIVLAADAERARLEQNLHDGAQQRFLAVGLLLGTLEATTTHPATAAGIAEIREHLELALRDLRDLARGLPPGKLRLGLLPALKEATSGYPFPIEWQVPDDLPDPVALTAYFAISEALANVAKHAHAAQAWVDARREGRMLAIAVRDDGRGGAEAGLGRGLSGIVDRVTAVGGRTDIHSTLGEGTSVKLWLPCE